MTSRIGATRAHWTRITGCIATWLACCLLAACANLNGPHQLELPLPKLQQELDKRFPVNQRALDIFDIRLTRPQLAILPGSERIALTIDASLAPSFLKQSWNGSLALSGRLFINAARSGIFLADPRVERLTLDGVDAARQRQFAKILNQVTDPFVVNLPLYTFRPEDLRYAGLQFVPTRIATTPGALVVTFELAK